MLYIVLGVKPKQWWYVFWYFFKIGLCSALSFKRSPRELSIYVAEHRSMLKKYQNTRCPRFSFIPKTGEVFSKTGVLFLLCKPVIARLFALSALADSY